MSTQVVLPLEAAVNTISGLDEITTVTSGRQRPKLTCTFVLERDIEGAAQDVREKIAGSPEEPSSEHPSAGHTEVGSGLRCRY